MKALSVVCVDGISIHTVPKDSDSYSISPASSILSFQSTPSRRTVTPLSAINDLTPKYFNPHRPEGQ